MNLPRPADGSGTSRLPAGLQVLLVDDHPTVRAGLATLLRCAGVLETCAEAADGVEALARLQTRAFDLAIVDVAMPRLGGLELVQQLRAAGSGLPVLMLSMHTESVYALRAFEAGANGYLGKDAAAPQLVAAIAAVAAGGSHVPPALAGRVRQAPGGRVVVQPHAGLSGRELMLLRLLVQGVSETEAALQMEWQPGEVERSRARIAQKLGLGEPADWPAYGRRHGRV